MLAAGGLVLFGGEGGDEFFGGYDVYAEPAPVGVRFCPSPYTGWSEAGVKFVQDDTRRLQADLSAAWTDSLDAYAHVSAPGDRVALAMMYCDAAYQLFPVGLRSSELMSAMWSLEARSIYARRPVVEFALNLPLWAKVDPDTRLPRVLRTKALLKQLFLRIFPKELLVEKQGFSGFPNEAASYLGPISDYLALGTLGIVPESVMAAQLSRAAAWKLTNIEYFLRRRG